VRQQPEADGFGCGNFENTRVDGINRVCSGGGGAWADFSSDTPIGGSSSKWNSLQRQYMLDESQFGQRGLFISLILRLLSTAIAELQSAFENLGVDLYRLARLFRRSGCIGPLALTRGFGGFVRG
jgi:hypothetical protein